MGIILGIIIFLLMCGSVAIGVWLHYKKLSQKSSIVSDLKDEISIIERKIRDCNYDFNRYHRTEDEILKHNEKIKEYEESIGEKKNQLSKQKPKLLKSILLYCFGGVMLFAFIFIPFSFHQINTGEIAVVKKWGKAEYTKSAGTHFDFWIGKKYQKYDTKIRQLESQTMAYSQDAQTMDLQLTIQYRIQADKVLEINKEFGNLELLDSRIKSIIEDKTKSTMSSMQAMKIIENRNSLSSQVLANISEVSDRYYVEIVNVLITNIDFSDAFEQAVENKMISEQQQLQAEYEAKKAETEAQGRLEVAKLEAEAQLEKARKEAQAIEVKAEAEANALKIIEQAWNEIPEDVKQVMLQEMAIDKWNGSLPETIVGTEFLEWLMGSINN